MFKSPKPQSIETYLAQIAGELHALPAQARADELREIESHLRAMIEQRSDVAAALEQFGAPRVVGRDLRRAWERKQPEAWWRAALAFCFIGAAHTIHYFAAKQFLGAYIQSDGASTVLSYHVYFKLSAFSPLVENFVWILMFAGVLNLLVMSCGAKIFSPKRGLPIMLAIVGLQMGLKTILPLGSPNNSLSILLSPLHLAQDVMIVYLSAYIGALFNKRRTMTRVR